ncbi:MAG TPA: elongation factor P [Planctomycetota bacterium]|nr:elongation factor P [Planctomycetota bacterium]
MAIRATEIRKGMVLLHEKDFCLVLDYQHITPGNWRAIHQVKMRNLRTGSQVQLRLGSNDTVEVAYLEKHACEYLYQEGRDRFVFMNTDSYEQFTLPSDVIGETMRYVTENSPVTVVFHGQTPISVELPSAVVLEVVEAEHAVKGDSVSNIQKNAKVQTGLELRVPMHIQVGDRIKVSTENGEFISRAKEGE